MAFFDDRSNHLISGIIATDLIDTDLVRFPEEDTLADPLINVENVPGEIANDTIVDNDANNALFGDADGNLLEVNFDSDTLDEFGVSDSSVLLSLANGTDVVTNFEGGLERLDASNFSLGVSALDGVVTDAQQISGDALPTFADNTVLRTLVSTY